MLEARYQINNQIKSKYRLSLFFEIRSTLNQSKQ